MRKKKLAEVFWADVKRQQNLYGIENEELAAAANVSLSTLYSYNKDPSAIRLKTLERMVNKLGIEVSFTLAN